MQRAPAGSFLQGHAFDHDPAVGSWSVLTPIPLWDRGQSLPMMPSTMDDTMEMMIDPQSAAQKSTT